MVAKQGPLKWLNLGTSRRLSDSYSFIPRLMFWMPPSWTDSEHAFRNSRGPFPTIFVGLKTIVLWIYIPFHGLELAQICAGTRLPTAATVPVRAGLQSAMSKTNSGSGEVSEHAHGY